MSIWFVNFVSFFLYEQFHEIKILGAPVYLSNPHFFQADPSLIAEVEGLKPNRTLHQTYFKIQPVPFVLYLIFLLIEILISP